MTTSRLRSFVSVAALLGAALTLTGCASLTARPASDALASSDEGARSVRFDNDARDYVHVYLVSETREWLLGRVEAGARAKLRIPGEALEENSGSMQLVVRFAGSVSQHVAGDPRATTTILQPTAELLTQRWTYSQSVATGWLTPLPMGKPGNVVSRP